MRDTKDLWSEMTKNTKEIVKKKAMDYLGLTSEPFFMNTYIYSEKGNEPNTRVVKSICEAGLKDQKERIRNMDVNL